MCLAHVVILVVMATITDALGELFSYFSLQFSTCATFPHYTQSDFSIVLIESDEYYGLDSSARFDFNFS
jgi:hypothetical protein